MGSERRFAAINTKIRVLKSKLLTKKDYINLIKKDKVKDQISYLKENTVYKDVLEDTGDTENIQEVETQLKKYLIYQYEKLIPYFTGEYRKLFKSILLRFEIEDLKLYLRALGRKEDLNKIKKATLLKESYSNINFDKLSKSKNLEEFIENLKGTLYYNVLKPYSKEEYKRILYYMEMNLDRLYFNLLKAQSLKLDKKDSLLFGEILGKNIDLLNIEWIYRGIKFYNLSSEELINYTLSNGYEFNYEAIKEMCYSKEERLIEIVLSTRYNFLFDTEKDVDLYMERRIERYLYYQFINAFKKGKLDITLSIAYMHLLEYEIRDIISILEAKKYDLSLMETKEYLVRKIEGSDE
ncbi:V-type ATPase subunit [Tissierella sp. MSJ-40]|uniref:V-type ATPase subunit n=1 Tax=Tissierella simiarum TaxID=2841534 RepID=A0ABS6E909_9FIRM|nr:V-type ATPase subunit [Tissierella simiarum]MBU5439396.1 V-type ATPase subunit [Tissierella simiarum]